MNYISREQTTIFQLLRNEKLCALKNAPFITCLGWPYAERRARCFTMKETAFNGKLKEKEQKL